MNQAIKILLGSIEEKAIRNLSGVGATSSDMVAVLNWNVKKLNIKLSRFDIKFIKVVDPNLNGKVMYVSDQSIRGIKIALYYRLGDTEIFSGLIKEDTDNSFVYSNVADTMVLEDLHLFLSEYCELIADMYAKRLRDDSRI